MKYNPADKMPIVYVVSDQEVLNNPVAFVFNM